MVVRTRAHIVMSLKVSNDGRDVVLRGKVI